MNAATPSNATPLNPQRFWNRHPVLWTTLSTALLALGLTYVLFAAGSSVLWLASGAVLLIAAAVMWVGPLQQRIPGSLLSVIAVIGTIYAVVGAGMTGLLSFQPAFILGFGAIVAPVVAQRDAPEGWFAATRRGREVLLSTTALITLGVCLQLLLPADFTTLSAAVAGGLCLAALIAWVCLPERYLPRLALLAVVSGLSMFVGAALGWLLALAYASIGGRLLRLRWMAGAERMSPLPPDAPDVTAVGADGNWFRPRDWVLRSPLEPDDCRRRLQQVIVDSEGIRPHDWLKQNPHAAPHTFLRGQVEQESFAIAHPKKRLPTGQPLAMGRIHAAPDGSLVQVRTSASVHYQRIFIGTFLVICPLGFAVPLAPTATAEQDVSAMLLVIGLLVLALSLIGGRNDTYRGDAEQLVADISTTLEADLDGVTQPPSPVAAT